MRGKSSKKNKESGDSIWGLVVGWAKNLNTTPEHVLYEMSFENMILYSAATPAYGDEQSDWDDGLDANNPDNFKKTKNGTNEEIFVR